jgi:hypothetical protein
MMQAQGAEEVRVEKAPCSRDDKVFLPGVIREILVVVLGYLAYTWVRKAKVGGEQVGLAHAAGLERLQSALWLSPEHAVNGFVSDHRWLALVTGYYYATLHFVVTVGVMVWLHQRRPRHYRRLRTALVVCNYTALVVFFTWPLAPPRLADRGVDDIVKSAHVWGDLATSQAASSADLYAAMPSLHTAWSLWSGLAVAMLARRRWVRVLGAAYPLVTVFVIVGTGNHYILDAVAGAALLAVALGLAGPVVSLLDTWHVAWLTAWTQIRVRWSLWWEQDSRPRRRASRVHQDSSLD